MSVERKVFAGFALAVSVLLTLVVIAQSSLVRYQVNIRWVAHTEDVLRELVGLHLLMRESEGSVRGYVATGDTSFLRPFQATIVGIPARVERIQALTKDNPTQRRRLDSLSRFIRASLASRAATIALARSSGPDAARRRVATKTGQAQSDAVNRLLGDLEDQERLLLTTRLAATGLIGRRSIGLLSLGTLITLLTIALAALVTIRSGRKRQAAELAVKESERRLAAALDASRIGAWDLDLVRDTSVRSLRHDQIFGYETGLPDWGTKTFFRHVVPEDRARVQEQFATAAATGKVDYECRIIRPDRSIRWIATEGRVQRDDRGEAVRILGTVTDITERKTADAAIARNTKQLEAANGELEAFSYSVSHDLRAPLRHIDGFADLLRRHAGTALDEKGQGYLRTISESAKQMGRLIDDLLVFSRMGRTEMHTTTVDLGPVVAGVISDLQQDINGRSIDWTVGALPSVSGDPSMLKQVVANLLGNAVKYTGRRTPARIEIGVNPTPGNDVTLFVRDNGAGFDPRYAHKLFGVFQRLHTASEFEGTGIGLAIVRRIVTRHGGRTWAEGVPDVGATFFISLPRHEVQLTDG